MAVKTKRISTLIESQLPQFISSEYELFSKFVQRYYEQQELQGQALDVITNIEDYADIDFYEKSILNQQGTLATSVDDQSTTITLSNSSGFVEKNGFVRIDDEIVFYEEKVGNDLLGCRRGVSGNTSLGDLYTSSDFKTTEAAPHQSGAVVYNITNLFLYAFVRNFEKQYLASFPEKYLKPEVDKRTLIKNIKKFYRSKGTDASIKFVFNSLVAGPETKPEVYKPKDFTYRASNADWINIYALKVKILSGDPKELIGQIITQDDESGFASATVDNAFIDGVYDGETAWNIVLAPETVNGRFAISTKTRLEKAVPSSQAGLVLNAFSTSGFPARGQFLIDQEIFEYDSKNVNQFNVTNRGVDSVIQAHSKGTAIYKPTLIKQGNVTFITLGVVYNVTPSATHPYAYDGDSVQVSESGFTTDNPKIIDTASNNVRWIFNRYLPVQSTQNASVTATLDDANTDVSAIFEDDQYYYITSSGYPSHDILKGGVTLPVKDQNLLKLIRKQSTRTTEVYETSTRDVGILVNGVRIFSYKDEDRINFGKLESIRVVNQGRGYVNPPYVLVDNVPDKAYAVLSGEVIESVRVNTTDTFPKDPVITITSGRRASVKGIVTGGRVTSLQIEDAGEYYSTPPIVRITDRAGRGRFASYTSVITPDGRLDSFEQIDAGNFYTQENIQVDIIPVGVDATAEPKLKTWVKNRFKKYENLVDSNNGYLFQNINKSLDYGYGYLANPQQLRLLLDDNLLAIGTEPSEKTHSPILGFAYDGNPIYGPFACENPLDLTSDIIRMTSSYRNKNRRLAGPSVDTYPLGTFIDDYEYIHRSGTLDQNNGRYCVTPEYPEGTYAYFLTIDQEQQPKFPYIIGENFYSLPVDSNYNAPISQNELPTNVRRLAQPGMPVNGAGFVGVIDSVKSGTVESINTTESHNNFSVGCEFLFDSRGTDGEDIEAVVGSVKGKSVDYIESKEDKVVKLVTIQSAYLFEDDFLRQPASGASGQIIGNVVNDNTVILRNVIGTFDNTGTFSADIKTLNVLVDQNSSYTKGAIITLTDGIGGNFAEGEVLETTNSQNVVKLKVLSGEFVVNTEYYLQSDNLLNTAGTKIITFTSMSDNLVPFDVNQNVALVQTTEPHGLGFGDKVDIDINPDDSTKTKNYYVRKRLYQKVKFVAPQIQTSLNYDGIGRFDLLESGADYTDGTYTDVPLTGGSGTGAKANITVISGRVSSCVLSNGGTGYSKGEYLGVDDDSLGRSIASQSTRRLTLYVDHVGVAKGSTRFPLVSTDGIVRQDLFKIGTEIVKVVDIDASTVIVERAQEGTVQKDHFTGQAFTLYHGQYNFDPLYHIGSANGDGYIYSYDNKTHEALIVFNYGIEIKTANKITNSILFFDSSTPSRLVRTSSAEDPVFKFEISEDNVNFDVNPLLDIQEYYRYVFDTSHSSLTGSFFDISPSKNFNLVTVERINSTVKAGNPGSFVDVKFGFGSRQSANTYTEKVGTDFLNFYYFDKNGIIDAEGSYLKIVSDPLQGTKTLVYVTDTKFVYELTEIPLWDGSGSITYTTTGQFAIGQINSVNVVNLGTNYKKTPIVKGVSPSTSLRASGTVIIDPNTQTVTGFELTEGGSNYSKPKVELIDADGVGAEFNIVIRDGKIFAITAKNGGKNYTYAPEAKIIETDLKAYAESTNIGSPQSIRIIKNGGSYHDDKTVRSLFTSATTFKVKDFAHSQFKNGEKVVQTLGGIEVASGIVLEWRNGSNLLKVGNIRGYFRDALPIRGLVSQTSANIIDRYVSILNERIETFFDNQGSFNSDRGIIGVSNQKITDSFFYQDYSYVVKSKTPIDQWRELIKSTTHPAGFLLFGEVDIETDANIRMPQKMPKASHFSVVQLWDPDKNKITVESTRRVVTQSIQKVEDSKKQRGSGSVASSEFNFNDLRAFNVRIYNRTAGFYDDIIADGKPWWYKNPFDGRELESGDTSLGSNRTGTTTFQLRDLNDNPVFPVSANNLIISLDGVVQESGLAYTVQDDNIIFAQPPYGDGTKLTGDDGDDVTAFGGVTFYGRYITFNQNQYNDRYFKKLASISQRNGRWIDAANQIDNNLDFILEETLGYTQATYTAVDWNVKELKFLEDLEDVIKAFSHDLRFGGNADSFDFATYFKEAEAEVYYKDILQEFLFAVNYAEKLCRLAIRNWDYTEPVVRYSTGSTEITMDNTENIIVGSIVSSGRAFPEGTKVVRILDENTILVSRAATQNAGGSGGAEVGIVDIEGTTGGAGVVSSTRTVSRVVDGETFEVEPGDTYIAEIAFSGTTQATFKLSGINSGTYIDASDIIRNNAEYIKEEAVGWAQNQFPNIGWSNKTDKCKRDIGYLIDAITYHLRFGGNAQVVEFGQLYYIGNELGYINDQLNESLRTYEKAVELMVLAMRQTLPAGTYTAIEPVVDNSILLDTEVPYCADVEATLNTYYEIVDTILTEGRNLVPITAENLNPTGLYSGTRPLTNHDIILDPDIPVKECNDVISAINILQETVADIINGVTLTRSNPQYIDGKNKAFDLYWEDGSAVVTEEDEDLFIYLNGILQRPKFTESYPPEDSYVINRETVPNQIVFDVAPVWDQSENLKLVQEKQAVEFYGGVGVGNYKRLTIDYELVDGVRTGPFLILDVEDLTVQKIDDPRYVLVFLDGVLQRDTFSYEISGPNIFFKVPIQAEMKIDIRLLYGRDVGQTLQLYGYRPDLYYQDSTLTWNNLNAVGEYIVQQFTRGAWKGEFVANPVQVWQVRPDGTYNTLGEIINYSILGNSFELTLFGQPYEIIEGLKFVFAVKGRYYLTYDFPWANFNDYTLSVTKNADNIKVLRNTSQWTGSSKSNQSLFDTQKFVNVAPGYKIKIDGEDGMRSILSLPPVVYGNENRPNQQISNKIYGTVPVTSYNGVARGEGLSVVAILEYEKDSEGEFVYDSQGLKIPTGKIEKLEWNQRSYDPITQPTAYQYFTPPILEFVSLDGNGGGARASVLVSKGQVISVDIIDNGEGYTSAPKVVVARGFNVIRDTNTFGLDLQFTRLNPIIGGVGEGRARFNMAVSSSVTRASDPSVTGGFVSSILANIPADTLYWQSTMWTSLPAVEDAQQMPFLQPGSTKIGYWETGFDAPIVTPQTQPTNVVTYLSSRVDNIQSFSTFSVTKQITTTVERKIDNSFIENVNYYAAGAYTVVDFLIGDTVLYVNDTQKFTTNGKLMVGDEVVFYPRKISDRFIKITRAQDNTNEQDWLAGTFIRQIPDLISIAPVGIQNIQSEASIVTVGTVTNVSSSQKQRQIQIDLDSVQTVEKQIVLNINLDQKIASISTIESVRESHAEAGGKFVTVESAFNMKTNIGLHTQQPQIVTNVQTTKQSLVIQGTVEVKHDIQLQNITTERLGQPDPEAPIAATISEVSMVGSTTVLGAEIQAASTIVTVSNEVFTQFFFDLPPAGFVDGYVEDVNIVNPFTQRNGNVVFLIDPKIIQLRSGFTLEVDNFIFGENNEYVGNYLRGNVGPTIGNFDYVGYDDGTANVSGLSIGDMDRLFRGLTITDFEERRNTSYTKSNEYFNLGLPSIQNPVAIYTGASGAVPGTVDVASTAYFPDSGNLYYSDGTNFGVIYYSGRTATQFLGCVSVNGANNITTTSEIIPMVME